MQHANPIFESTDLECLILGAAAVGKSALLQRLCKDTFTEVYSPTIGMAFDLREFITLTRRINLKIWDAGSDARFAEMVANRCQNAAFVMIVLDSKAEMDLATQLQTWITAHSTLYEQLPANVFVIVTKCDETASQSEGQSADKLRFIEGVPKLYQYCQTLTCNPEIYYASAKTGEGVENLFVAALRKTVFGYEAAPKKAIAETKEQPASPTKSKAPDMSFVDYLLVRLNLFGKGVYVDMKSKVFGTHHLSRASAMREALKAYDNDSDRLDLVYNQLELLGAEDIPTHEAPKTSAVKPAYVHPYWTDPANMEFKPAQAELEKSGYYQELMKIRLGLERCLQAASPRKKV
jgi:Ras-related protein Rab-1A/Rab family protein